MYNTVEDGCNDNTIVLGGAHRAVSTTARTYTPTVVSRQIVFMRPAINVRPKGTMHASALSKVLRPSIYIVFQKGLNAIYYCIRAMES